eukprot:gene25819-3953_t
MVLLKNDAVGARPVLPIDPSATVALLGPHFNSTQDLLSDYCPGHWCPMAARDLLGARLAGYAQGCALEG